MDRFNQQPISLRSMKILRAFEKHGSAEAMRAADPSISLTDIAQAYAELNVAISGFAGASGRVMKPKRAKAPAVGTGYQLKITLRGSRPPIWRRIVVPADISLDKLHYAIQISMGWQDCHLHMFEAEGRRFEMPNPADKGYREYEDEREFRLFDLVNREKEKFRYEYDFGDGWEHVIVLEKVIPAESGPKLFTCLAGKNACPVEDSGGIWGYYHKLAILADPTHPEHQGVLDWMGEVDPAEFSVEKTSGTLRGVFNP
jgi:hypothetical protein